MSDSTVGVGTSVGGRTRRIGGIILVVLALSALVIPVGCVQIPEGDPDIRAVVMEVGRVAGDEAVQILVEAEPGSGCYERADICHRPSGCTHQAQRLIPASQYRGN